MPNKFQEVIDGIDLANQQDPHLTPHEGKQVAHEWLYSQRMRHWLNALEPEADELLKLAVYGQHIKRWTIPRKTYPEGKVGYYAWRNKLKSFHGEEVGKLMLKATYSAEQAVRVKEILSKNLLGHDDQTQILEDVICLVFLESYFSDFSKNYDDERLGVIVLKTWKKMSERGQKVALTLPFRAEDLARIQKALAML